jgi:hypothetical protein
MDSPFPDKNQDYEACLSSVSQGSPPVNSPSLLHHHDYVDTLAGGAMPCTSLSCSHDEAMCTPKCQKLMDAEIQTSRVSFLGPRKNEREIAADTNEDSSRCLSTGSRHTCNLQEVDTSPGVRFTGDCAARANNQPLFGKDGDVANRVFILATPAEIESDRLAFAGASRQDLVLLDPRSINSAKEMTTAKCNDGNRKPFADGTKSCKGQLSVPLREVAGASFQVVSTGLDGMAARTRYSAFVFGDGSIDTGGGALDLAQGSEASGRIGRIGSQRHPAASHNSRRFKLTPRRMKLHERPDDNHFENSG